MHYIFKNEFECWVDMHIIQAALAIAGSIALVSMSFIITLTLFKSLHSMNDASSKSDSKADVLRLLRNTIIVYSFAFLR